jgi:hypothetical protein
VVALIRDTGWFESGDRERKNQFIDGLVDGYDREAMLDFFDQWAAEQRGS